MKPTAKRSPEGHQTRLKALRCVLTSFAGIDWSLEEISNEANHRDEAAYYGCDNVEICEHNSWHVGPVLPC